MKNFNLVWSDSASGSEDNKFTGYHFLHLGRLKPPHGFLLNWYVIGPALQSSLLQVDPPKAFVCVFPCGAPCIRFRHQTSFRRPPPVFSLIFLLFFSSLFFHSPTELLPFLLTNRSIQPVWPPKDPIFFLYWRWNPLLPPMTALQSRWRSFLFSFFHLSR